MAKIRRIVRKLAPANRSFDEQLWPVHFALFILGAYLAGVVVAVSPIESWLDRLAVGIVIAVIFIFIAGVMGIVTLIDSRKVNRRVLLATVLSLIINFMFVTAMTRVVWRDYVETALRTGAERPETKRKVIPEYHEFQINPSDNEKPEFLKPVETDTVETKQPELERKEAEQEEAKPRPETADVPKTEVDVRPNTVEKKEVEESTPRRSETQSKLSRQETKFKPNASAQAAAVKVASQAENKPTPVKEQPTEVARQSPSTQASRKSEVEPTTTREASEVDLSKRETVKEEVAHSSSAPTLKRSLEKPTTLPRTTAAAEVVTAPVAKETSPEQVTPNTTAANKQLTTSPQVAKESTEPTPDSPTEVAQAKTERQQMSERMPQLAQSNASSPNRRRPTATIPQANSAATAETTPTASPAAKEVPNLRPSVAQVTRQSTETPTPSRAPQPTDAPQPSRPAEISTPSPRRAQSSAVASASPESAPTRTPSRTAAQISSPTNAQAQSVQVAASEPKESTKSPQPAGAVANKQQTSAAVVTKAAAEPTPETPSAVASVSPTVQTRQDVAQPAPTVASTNTPVARRTAPSSTVPAAANMAAAQATPNSSPVKSESTSPAPSASTVARQQAQSSASSNSPRAADVPSTSPSTELARAQTPRAQTSDAPSILPNSRPTNSPTRSTRIAQVAVSPAATAAPSMAEATRATSNPSAEPARTALTKAFNGIAGSGRSANLDRNAPASDQQRAMVASGSASRAKASQQMDPGPALSPSSPARVSRSRAGANAPSATLAAAETVENATRAGGAEPAELDASASAAVERMASNAATGPVTAARGEIEIDLGATQRMSENSTGKASGGGQPTLNFETQSNRLARSNVGGAPQPRLATADVAEVAAAPAGDGGGEPTVPEASPEATSIVRTEAGGASPTTGGPTAPQSEPTSESAMTQQVAEAKVGRAETIQAAPAASPAAGGGTSSPARAASGPKEIASLVTAVTAQPAEAGTPPSGVPDGSPPAPAEIKVARAEGSGGAPTTGGPSKADEVGVAEAEAGGEGRTEAMIAAAQGGRAEAIETTVGAPSAGGGTASPTRQSTGPAFTAQTKADVVALAGAPTSSGAPQGSPIEAQGTEAVRASAGIAGKAASEISGALAAADTVDAPATGAVGDVPGGRRASPADEDGPAVGDVASGGGLFKRSAQMQLPSAAVEQIAVADAGGGSVTSDLDAMAMASGMDSTGMTRQEVGGLPVDVAAPEGPGGVGTEVAVDAGAMNRRAQAESQVVHFREARFQRTQTGGPLAMNLSADLGVKAFEGRSKLRNKELAGDQGASPPKPGTERSIELGLRFLANHQSGDGSWSLSNFGGGRRGYEKEATLLHTDTAATGLALLAFLGAGYNHQDDQYKEVVRSAIDYLVKNQKPDGNLYLEHHSKSGESVWLYSHGIATLALCEAYGMTQDPDLRGPAQKAVDFVVSSQNKTRGGWRYAPGIGSDTSVTGWMVMAMKSGKMAGLEVPQSAFDGVDKWLNSAQGSSTESHLYVYNPYAQNTPDQRHGRDVSKTMTSVGLLMRLYSGWKPDDPQMQRGAEYLLQNLPSNGTRLNPQRDTYYWYYATQVMYHMRGRYWEEWNDRLHPLLTDTQIQTGPMAGSWEPRGQIPDRWAAHAGRIYVTTLNLLSLEVYHRILPLYDESVK